jgi:hypothetical protein
LGQQCLGFHQRFWNRPGVLPASMREVVIERAMAAPGEPVSLDDLKIIILMVYWSFGREPDALVLDELCDDNSNASRTDRNPTGGCCPPWRSVHQALRIGFDLGQRIARGTHGQCLFFLRQQQARLQIGGQTPTLNQIALART